MTRPLIVTAELAPADQRQLDALRRRHFPPERNQLAAHVTMFHALPPSALAEVEGLLRAQSRQAPPEAWLDAVMDLGGGTAFRIRSPGLVAIRDALADSLQGLLTAQDQAGWRPHVTIQNKVPREAARALQSEMRDGFEPRPLSITGLGLHHYCGGPWERAGTYRFRGF